jgi:uncharacterized protein YhfF
MSEQVPSGEGQSSQGDPGATGGQGSGGTVAIDRGAGLRMYADFLAANPQVPRQQDVEVVCFGDTAELADELGGFIVDGLKRATATLVAGYLAAGDTLPPLGAYWVCCDGSGQPRAVLRTTELRLGPFRSVDTRFAWDEGEYDRTLRTWLDGHRRAYERQCARLGIEFSEDLEVCFERFVLVWPPDLAD